MPKTDTAAQSAGTLGEVNRAQIEHRAVWMGLIYDELVQAGADAESILRRAIKRCGRIHGEKLREKCGNPRDCREFRTVFLSDLVIDTFAMRPIAADADNLAVDFHYCPLVSAWRKLGFSDETCALLCDIAMEGDRGIAEVMGLTLDLQKTIARGCSECKLHFSHFGNSK
ncbi:MAG: L-2-amino-thiazoline-4-carboxylic acid hydrolase [Spirochaetaceae bacterium]|jgi:hypothetical protein|nr:L-2-amino-thiazoline-4-carboxylic acid hydrolase [Spirochaetaceae bacterium]